MFRRTALIILSLLCSIAVWSQSLSNKARISLLTCTPGNELYARYGHTAIRVCDPENELDIVFNYGVFSFETDHFYWKFVKGETYYQLGLDDTQSFVWIYAFEHRNVYEQVLNLDSTQTQHLFDALLLNYQPENRFYLYNFVFDNCATRPYYLIKEVLGDSITSTYIGHDGITYRRFIQHYTHPYSWEDFGINMLFGKRANAPMTGEQRLFLPEELMFYISEAKFADGRPLVLKENIQPFVIQPTPWYDNYWFGLLVIAAVMVGISLYDRHRKKLSWGVDVFLGIIYLILLTIVIFLVFFSIHPLVGFGWRLLIIPVLHLCTRLIYLIR